MIGIEEITRLYTGREMDILVAEEIMGWLLETDEAKLRRLNSYFQRDEGRRWWRTPEGAWHSDLPDYSTDLVTAWQVVERMNDKGVALFLVQGSKENNAAFDERRATDPGYITDKCMAGAICKAALIASSRLSEGRHNYVATDLGN